MLATAQAQSQALTQPPTTQAPGPAPLQGPASPTSQSQPLPPPPQAQQPAQLAVPPATAAAAAGAAPSVIPPPVIPPPIVPEQATTTGAAAAPQQHAGDDYDPTADGQDQSQEALRFAAEIRQDTINNTLSVAELADRAREAASGQAGDRDRFLFGSTWLHRNFEAAEEYNMPRQDVYDQYKLYCDTMSVPPVSSPMFGKIVKIIFPELKTRRLGTRGQSRYHYCGIRVKGSHDPANASQELQNPFSALLMSGIPQGMTLNPMYGSNGQGPRIPLPDFPPITESFVPLGTPLEAIIQFVQAYKIHSQQILDALQTMQFPHVEVLLRSFWTTLPEASRRLVNSPESIELIWRCDSILYDTIMNVLLPNPMHQLPMPVTQAVRHFARQLESWILAAMDGYYPMLVARKVEVAKVFAQQLKRHTSLNFLAQAAAAVLETAEQMHAMFLEWSRLDFEGIKDQASWVTECRKVEVTQIAEMEVKNLLTSSSKLDQWTVWLDSKLDPARYIHQARQFLMKWNFYTALCLRDLTLRSMSTFGAFHIVILFLNEYLFFVVEQRIANVQSLAAPPPPPPMPSGAPDMGMYAPPPPPAAPQAHDMVTLAPPPPPATAASAVQNADMLLSSMGIGGAGGMPVTTAPFMVAPPPPAVTGAMSPPFGTAPPPTVPVTSAAAGPAPFSAAAPTGVASPPPVSAVDDRHAHQPLAQPMRANHDVPMAVDGVEGVAAGTTALPPS
ncbi:Transcription factor rfx3 [Allomyces javanicus]|nr:Transcription factor rfx3 [Allomyces javanicus]